MAQRRNRPPWLGEKSAAKCYHSSGRSHVSSWPVLVTYDAINILNGEMADIGVDNGADSYPILRNPNHGKADDQSAVVRLGRYTN